MFLEAESDDIGCGGGLPPADKEAGAPRAALPLQHVFGIEDAVERTRLDDSDDEGSAAVSAAQEQGSDGKLVINGIEGRVALPGFEVGLMTRNAMKESLESAVQSFRSKSVVSRGGWLHLQRLMVTREQGKLTEAEGSLLGYYMWALQHWSYNPTASTTTYLQLHKYLQLDHLDASTWGTMSFASACALAEVHALRARVPCGSAAFPRWAKIVLSQAAPNGIADYGGCAFICACR